VLGVASCTMVGPDYHVPDAPVASRWSESEDARTRAAAVDTVEWWHVFDDPVLDRLITEARSRNLDLQAAALRVLQARARRAIAFGNLFPQNQAVAASYRRARISENRSGTAQELNNDLWDLTFDVSWEVDMWGRIRRQVEAADAQLLAQLASYDDVLVTLFGEIASTYVRIRVLEERLALARDNVRVQSESLGIARVRYEAGGTSELDVQQAETLLADTEASIPELEIGLRQAEHTLSVLLGAPPGDVSQVLSGSRGIPAAPPAVAAGIPADLLRRRPDVRLAERNLAAQSARIGVAKGVLLPRLQLVGSIGLAANSAADWFDGGSFEALGGPRIDWPILNYGRIINAVRTQDARFEELAVVYAQTVLAAQREVEDAMVGYLRGAEQVTRLAESVAAAKRAVDLSLVQYREGAADYTRVLTTQQAKLREDDSFATSRGAVTLNVITLYRAMGGGWQLREGEELVPAATAERMRKRTYWGGTLETRSVTTPNEPAPQADMNGNAGSGGPVTTGDGAGAAAVPAAAPE